MRKPGFIVLAAVALLVSAAMLPAGAKRTAARVYVTNERDGTMSVIDGARDQLIRTIPLDARARGLALSRDGSRLYVALSHFGPGASEKDRLGVIDTATGRVLHRYLVGLIPSEPEGVAVRPDGRIVYVTGETSSTISVIQPSPARVTATFMSAARPRAIAFGPAARPDHRHCQGGSGSVGRGDLATRLARR